MHKNPEPKGTTLWYQEESTQPTKNISAEKQEYQPKSLHPHDIHYHCMQAKYIMLHIPKEYDHFRFSIFQTSNKKGQIRKAMTAQKKARNFMC
jgi:hypothetical protein